MTRTTKTKSVAPKKAPKLNTIGTYACAGIAVFLQEADDESVLFVIHLEGGELQDKHRFNVEPGNASSMSKAKECFFNLVESAIHRTSRSMMQDGPYLPDSALRAMTRLSKAELANA